MPELQGAVIEIIERRNQPVTGLGGEVVVPDEVRINGQALLTPPDSPVTIHEIVVGQHDLVRVTLTLVAKRIFVGAEEPSVATTEGRASKLYGGGHDV